MGEDEMSKLTNRQAADVALAELTEMKKKLRVACARLSLGQAVNGNADIEDAHEYLWDAHEHLTRAMELTVKENYK